MMERDAWSDHFDAVRSSLANAEFELDSAIDNATLAIRGLTERHIVGISADDARRLAFRSTAETVLQLRQAIGRKTGAVRVFTTVAVLRPIVESLERRRDAA